MGELGVTEQVAADLERISAVARAGLGGEYVGRLPADFRLDAFVVVPVFSWTEGGGLHVDMATTFSESRRAHVERGILEMALDTFRA